jgi:hypothetical protein
MTRARRGGYLNIVDYLKKYGWIAFYYSLILAVLLVQHGLSIEPNVSTVLLIALFAIPFLLPRLSSLEYGGLKVEMRDLKNEVRETKHDVRREVSEVRQGYEALSAQLNELIPRSREYLQPQPLEVSNQKIEAIRIDRRRSAPLSNETLLEGLNSLEATARIVAYVELQVRPRANIVSDLIDCLWLEQLEARRANETRPLWQLLVAIQRCAFLPNDPIRPDDLKRLELLMKHCLQFLESMVSVDPGGECKERLRLLLGHIEQLRRGERFKAR